MLEQTVTHALSRLDLDRRGGDLHPRQPAPMLLQRADKVFASPDWVYEAKWDGFRTLASVRDGAVRLISRNGASFTNLFGPVSDALRALPMSIVLDGEVIAINDKGQPDFEALQARLRPRNGKLPGHICYMVFDVLYVNGHSLLNRPLEERGGAPDVGEEEGDRTGRQALHERPPANGPPSVRATFGGWSSHS